MTSWMRLFGPGAASLHHPSVMCALCHQLTRSCVTQPLPGLFGEVFSMEEKHT